MYLLEIILILVFILAPQSQSISAFSEVSFVSNVANTRIPFEFTFGLTFSRNLSINEVVVINLPKFYGQSTSNLFISPSIKFRAIWVRSEYMFFDINVK